MSNKLYVGNLSYETNEDDLRELFKDCGNIVSVKIITDQQTGQSRGFGFVELETAAQASKAISSLNGSEVKGKTIKVNEAQNRNDHKGGGNRGGGGGFRSNSRRY